MVWCNRGFNAIRVAWIVVGITWLYSIVYVTAIGTLYGSEPDSIFRPSPVCLISLSLSHTHDVTASDIFLASVGAGLANTIRFIVCSEPISGCGYPFSRPFSCIFHSSSGAGVTSQSAINSGASRSTDDSKLKMTEYDVTH